MTRINVNNNMPIPTISKRKKRHSAFPLRLYDMLEDAEELGYGHVISWMPDGKSFKIHVDGTQDIGDEKIIVQALQRAFNMTRYRSFLRQLQLYGFERICKGPHRGECKHELLVRGQRDILSQKSVEDFQRSDDDNSNSPRNSARDVRQLLSPESIFLKNDNSNYWMPTCAFQPNTQESSCQYMKTSTIPTTLFNLNLTRNYETSGSSQSNNRDDERYQNLISKPEEQNGVGNDSNYDTDSVPMVTGDRNYDWITFETEMLRTAM